MTNKMRIKVSFLNETLTDFSQPRFEHIKKFVPFAVRPLLKGPAIYGRIGHPADDCSPEEFLSQPSEEVRAFSIHDIGWLKDSPEPILTGTIQFEDSPIGREAKFIFLGGGRFSIRSAFDGNILEVITWDLIPANN